MSKKIHTLWHQQSPRDQVYLMVGAVITGIFLLWVGLCQPLIEWRDKEQQRLANLTRTLTTVESLASQLEQQPRVGGRASDKGNLAEIIDASLRDNNLRMKGFQPGRNGDVRLNLENAAYQPLMQWLYDLEYKYNLHIIELNLAQTQTAGVLTASLNLKQQK